MYPKLTSALYLIAWKPADNIFIDIFMWLISSLEEILFEISDNWLFHYLGLMLSSVSRNSSTGRVWNSLQTLLLSGLKQNVGIFKYVQNLSMNCILFMGKYCSMQALLWWQQQQQQQHNNVSVSSSLLSAVRSFCHHRESKEPKEGVVEYGYISGTVVVQIWAIPNPDTEINDAVTALAYLKDSCKMAAEKPAVPVMLEEDEPPISISTSGAQLFCS